MLSTDTEHCSGETEARPCTCGRTERDKTDKTINTQTSGGWASIPVLQNWSCKFLKQNQLGVRRVAFCDVWSVRGWPTSWYNITTRTFSKWLFCSKLMLNFYTCQIQMIPKMKEKNKWIRNQIWFFLLWKTGWLSGFLAGVAPVGAAIVRLFEKPDVKLHYVKN